MSDEEAFLHAIRASPRDDDTVRLVFADWLDEHGNPDRAEFIRVQCELEPIRADLDSPRVQELMNRERELLYEHENEWLGDAWQFAKAKGEVNGPYFRRGMPEVVCIWLGTLLENDEELLATLPTLRELAVCIDAYHLTDKLAKCEWLNRIDTLEIALDTVKEVSEVLLASPFFRRLPTVRVWYGSEGSGRHWFTSPMMWPTGMRIEVVDIGGASVRSPGYVNDEVDELAKLFADAGRTLVPIRPALDRFALQPHPYYGFHPGWLEDGSRVLIAQGWSKNDPMVIVFFDDNGYFLESRQYPGPDNDVEAWLTKEYGYRPATLWMREFTTPEGLGIQHLHERRIESMEDPWEWLYNKRYAINWGGGHGHVVEPAKLPILD